MRKLIRNIVAICVALFVLGVAGYIWDKNSAVYDRKQLSMQIYDSIRAYRKSGDMAVKKDAVTYIYVGSRKTKALHTFRSDCALKINSTDLAGFDKKEDAVKAGYTPCDVCCKP